MMQRIRKRPWMIPALLLVLVFAAGLILEAVKPLSGHAETLGAKWVDEPTDMKYEEALGSSESTRYSGRVWADKTVYKDNVEVELPNSEGGNYTVDIGDSDFIISYSMLTTTAAISGKAVVPMDVVFVIDLSTSMAEEDKIGQTVVALNQSMETLMNGHPDTRIAVVTYSNEAQVLLPLDHYQRIDEQEYFSLDGQGEGQILSSHVINSAGETVETSAHMSGWTNIHMGMDTGMDLLLQANTTTEGGVSRHPALMLMSDGAPTCAGSDDSPWWDPSGVSGDGYADSSGVYTLKTVMNAAYQKQRVTAHYGQDFAVYTVGVAVGELDSSYDRVSALLTLNPGQGILSNNAPAPAVIAAWRDYYVMLETPTLGGYTFQHPKASQDITSLYYNDGYFYAENANEVSTAFQQVLNKIIITAAVPTEVTDDPKSDGYITYTDPIGEYMEVKDVKLLVWDGKPFHNKSQSTVGNETTYVFEGDLNSPLYGSQSLSLIKIVVTTDPVTKDQTLVVDVPAALIPLRLNTVTLNDDGTVQSNVSINNEPLRLFYTVGMREDVLTDDNKVDLTQVDSEYIADHTTQCNNVVFYSNRYSANTENQAGVEKTVGDATVTFVPAKTNPFYYNQEDRPLYADPECTVQAEPGASTVYVKVSYYDGIKSTFVAVERSTSYNPEDIMTGEDGFLYLKAGSRCNLSDRIIDKGEGNVTGTAETYHYPIYSRDEQTGEITGIQLYLGNNGALIGDLATGELTVSKTVTGNMGETDRGFVFDITLYHGTSQVPLNGTFAAAMTPGESTTQPSVVTSATPSVAPSETSSATPSVAPSETSSATPSVAPSEMSSATPSVAPSETPSATPSVAPSETPSATPSVAPSETPSATPSVAPSETPSAVPSVAPSETPSAMPSVAPSATPSVTPSVAPSPAPSSTPISAPSEKPTPSPMPPIDECPQPSLDPGEVAIQFVDGKAQVTLKDGESITIQGLPAGYTYTVTEHNPDTEDLDYTVTATQNGQAVTWDEEEALACTGTIVDKQTDQVAYTNKCYIPMVDFSFIKVDGTTFHSDRVTEVTTLSGAQFVLYQYQGTAWETDQTALLNPQETNANWGQVGSTVTSHEDGMVIFTNLRAGNYRLIETVAPDGYQLPKGQWNLTVAISGEENQEVGTFTVEAIGNSTMDAPAMAQVDQVYYLMNYKPIDPPITGGDGGEDFRIGGGVLMLTGMALAAWWAQSSPRKRREFL